MVKSLLLLLASSHRYCRHLVALDQQYLLQVTCTFYYYKKYPSVVNSHAFCIYAIVIEWPVTIVGKSVTPGKINLLLLASHACKDVYILCICSTHYFHFIM